MNSFKRTLSHALDAILAILVLIWIAGGVSWGGRMHLTHGADLKRTGMILIAVAMAARFADHSFFVRAARRFGKRLEIRAFRWTVWGVACVLAVTVGALQTLGMRYALWDVGLFHQILWSLTHGHGFTSTVSAAGNFLQDHLSLSLAVLAPLFALSGGSPLFLPVVHALMIFGGVAAWIYLAERVPSRWGQRLPAAVTLFAVSFDSLWGNLRWGFHESAFSFLALSWAFALIFTNGSTLAVIALGILAALSKEIMLPGVAIFFLIFSARKRNPIPAVLSLILLAAFVYYESIPHPATKNYFENYYGYLGLNLRAFFSSLLLSPWKVVQRIGAWELTKYLFRILFPWLALPLIAPRRSWLLSALPSFAAAAIATHPPLRLSDFHYILELWPVLAALTVLALAQVRDARWIWTWALLSFFALDHDPFSEMKEYAHDTIVHSQAREAVAAIPSSAGVVADELAGPWITARERVSRIPDLRPFPDGCPDWVLSRGSEYAAFVQAYRERCGGKVVWQYADWQGVRK